jgi:uncharacterized membrane protein YfcA
MEVMMHQIFPEITWVTAVLVVLLGFIGGVLSGFIGSGGAFFMTPGMMNLGITGVVAVGSNITHKFGKAIVGARKHAQMGNVDKRLAAFMLLTAIAGVQIAVWINSALFKSGAGGHGEAGTSPGADLYISAIFIGILTLIALSLLWDALRTSPDGEGPSQSISAFLVRLDLKPVIRFPVSDVEVSLWVLLPVGLATGYLAGTISVGGFIGVPAMIYLFGVPTAVAAGTELYLAIFMGAFGALSYGWQGFVDLRLAFLLFLGSLVGVHMGAYGVKVLSERMIRLSTGVIILLCALSRAVAVPVYLRALGWVTYSPGLDGPLKLASTLLLFGAGIGGAGYITFNVFKARAARRRIHATLLYGRAGKG